MLDIGNGHPILKAPAPVPVPTPAPAPAPPAAPAQPKIVDQRVPAATSAKLAEAAAAPDEPKPWEVGAEAIEMVAGVQNRDAAAMAAEALEQMAGGDIRAEMAVLREGQKTAKAVKAMPEAQQQQYQAVLQAAKNSGVPDADRAIEALARGGDFQKSPELLGALNQLATQPTRERLLNLDPNAANRLVGELARQLKTPGAIQQDPNFDTCAEAALEQQLATQRPAEYVQLVADMAGADTAAHMPNGAWVGLPLYGLEASEGSTRSLASSIYQQGVHAAYSQGKAEEGMTVEALQSVVAAQFPNQEVVTFGQDQAWAAVGKLQAGSLAMIETGDGTKHAVNVLSNHEGAITYSDPQGKLVKTSAEEFQAVLLGAVLPKDSGIRNTHENLTIGDGGSARGTSGAAGGRR